MRDTEVSWRRDGVPQTRGDRGAGRGRCEDAGGGGGGGGVVRGVVSGEGGSGPGMCGRDGLAGVSEPLKPDHIKLPVWSALVTTQSGS